MKTLKNITLSICLLTAMVSQAQNTKALRYYNRIIDRQYGINSMVVTFVHMQSQLDGKKHKEWCELERVRIEKHIGRSISRINSMGAFQGDIELKNASIALLEFYKRSFNVEYKELMALHEQKEHTTTDQAQIKEMRLRLISEEEALEHQLAVAQELFTERHYLNFIDLSTQPKDQKYETLTSK